MVVSEPPILSIKFENQKGKNNMKTNANLVTNKDLREELIGKVEVLDKVGTLLLLDELDMATVEMVAEYYGVTVEVVKMCVKNNRDEIENDGYSTYKSKDIEDMLSHVSKNILLTRNKANFKVMDEEGNVILSGGGRGVALFPKRAILRIGMLLRDSVIAKEVRTQLLNVVEVVKENNDEMLVQEIDKEKQLYMNIMFATNDAERAQEIDKEKQLYMNIMFATNDAERAIAINEHLKYMNRYKEKAKRYEEIYNSEKIYTVTEVAKDLGMSARKLNAILNNLGIQYRQNGTWHLYARHEHLVPSHCDYHITEYGQTMKWTNVGREWIMELLKGHNLA